MRSAGIGTLGVVALVLVAASVAADHLQRGVDPGHTGATLDEGPANEDVAFAARVRGAVAGEPLVVGRAAYVHTSAVPGSADLDTSGLWSVGLDDGATVLVTTFPATGGAIATDRTRLYAALNGTVLAVALTGGPPMWTWELPRLLATTLEWRCDSLVVEGTALYVGCTEIGVGFANDVVRSENSAVLVAALDPATGEVRWTWTKDASTTTPSTPVGPPAPGAAEDPAPTLIGLAAAAGNVYATTSSPTQAGAAAALWALDAATGEERFRTTALAEQNTVDQTVVSKPTSLATQPFTDPSPPLADGASVFVKVGHLYEHDLNGTLVWRYAFEQSQNTLVGGANRLARSGDALYVQTADRVVRLDAAAHRLVWSAPFEPFELSAAVDMTVAGDRLYIRINTPQGQPNALVAYDAATGGIVWRYTDPDFKSPRRFAVANGVLVLGGANGTVTVFGHTPASLAPGAVLSTAYPAVGATFTLDASPTAPGIQGPADEFAVDWGDGRSAEWQADPRFEHAYAEAGDVQAVVRARNVAGQTSRATVTFHVGAAPPTALSRAFDPEHQNTTFFLLGLVLTAAGAGYGTVRAARRRAVFRGELKALDAVFAAQRLLPAACERALAERRAHARSLVAAGKLDEGHMGLLATRVEELVRSLRLGALGEDLHRLPHGVVVELQEILADARVTDRERARFLDALDRDPALTAEQREKLKALVNTWTTRDRG